MLEERAAKESRSFSFALSKSRCSSSFDSVLYCGDVVALGYSTAIGGVAKSGFKAMRSLEMAGCLMTWGLGEIGVLIFVCNEGLNGGSGPCKYSNSILCRLYLYLSVQNGIRKKAEDLLAPS